MKIKKSSKTSNSFPLSLSRGVILPFLFSRLLLTLAAWLARIFPPYKGYPNAEALERGWVYTSHYLLDIWGRWDTGWYFSIAFKGYFLRGDPTEVASNVAFYPAYPYLIKWMALLLPDNPNPFFNLLLSGVLLSNICALAALMLLYRLFLKLFDDPAVAQRSIWLLLAFPSAFILSCVYTESLFLLLCVAAFGLGWNKQWLLACLCACLLGLVRPVGITLAVPLAWLYLEQRQWQFRQLRWDMLGFLFIPLGFLGFLYHIQQTTGSYEHAFTVMQNWGRRFTWPWVTLFAPRDANMFHTPVEVPLSVFLLVLSGFALKVYPSRSPGIMAFLLILPALTTGILSSIVRYWLVVWPVFGVAAVWLRDKRYFYLIFTLSALLQLVYFMGWVRFYWIF